MEFSKKYNDQWLLKADEEGYTIENPAEDGTRNFYAVTSGPYGNPVITAEPDLALEAPTTVTYENNNGEAAQPEEKIAGIICKKAGEVIHRFSLSSPKRPEFKIVDEGAELIIDGVRWKLRALFRKDKNRIINYDAYYGEEAPENVKLVELEDLDF
ncbi:hypothetical protein GF369_00080 [Candidatus Peregrinibacteria bacterium]|nr:hypothetical protein [Candidatus Peregrinibacteria bacterium]